MAEFFGPDGQRRLNLLFSGGAVRVVVQGKREGNSGNLMVSSITTSQLPAARDGRFLSTCRADRGEREEDESIGD